MEFLTGVKEKEVVGNSQCQRDFKRGLCGKDRLHERSRPQCPGYGRGRFRDSAKGRGSRSVRI